tara:strand:+ start:422 stop:775 length:354 start_codon:yes stop_codon:yes gene_type:complete
MKNTNYTQFIEDNTKSCDVSYRGGTLKIDASELFPELDDATMGAYQNYLGGGIAGAIQIGTNFNPGDLSESDQVVFKDLSEALKRYFYNINNGGGDDYMVEEVNSYEQNQTLPKSAY